MLSQSQPFMAERRTRNTPSEYVGGLLHLPVGSSCVSLTAADKKAKDHFPAPGRVRARNASILYAGIRNSAARNRRDEKSVRGRATINQRGVVCARAPNVRLIPRRRQHGSSALRETSARNIKYVRSFSPVRELRGVRTAGGGGYESRAEGRRKV